MAAEYNIDDSIATVQRQIESEAREHEKRMEFWNGYLTAMNEVKGHMGGDGG